MPDSQLLIAFLASAAVFAYAPGPSMLYAAAQTIAGGRRRGLQAALGIHLGGYIHVAIVALGVASLFSNVPLAYTAMKFVGSFYLCMLGINMWRTAAIEQVGATGGSNPDDIPARDFKSPNGPTNSKHAEDKTLFQSALVEVLNPKTAIFYLAFLPQFTEPDASLPVSMQLLVLGTAVNILFSSADLICVFFAQRIVSANKQSSGKTYTANKISGAVLILLGANLLIS